MTLAIIAISLWCGSPAYSYTMIGQYSKSQWNQCKQTALQCMAKASWKEEALPGCIGANK